MDEKKQGVKPCIFYIFRFHANIYKISGAKEGTRTPTPV